ncbi:MAG: hypothetical protein NVS2B5_28330 [Beijerinckiaceae bacterium]
MNETRWAVSKLAIPNEMRVALGMTCPYRKPVPVRNQIRTEWWWSAPLGPDRIRLLI